MKKWLIWAAAALLASCGHKANYSGKDTYVIQGESSAFVDGQYMFVADATNWSYLDSAKIEGHAFYLESRNTGTGIAMLYMGENSASRSLQQISNYFFPETGYALVCDGLFVEGSPWNETYNRLLKLHRKDPEAWKAQTTELVKTNLNVLGCHYLDELRGVLAWDELKELTARFAPEMGNHPLFLYVKDKIDAIRADVGTTYYDLASEGADGDTLALHRVVDQDGTKYVLLDFWSTWCAPCRKELPYVKAAYGKYKDKGFDIYGVAFDNNRENWKKTLAQEGMEWHNVIAPFDRPFAQHPFWRAYGLRGIPDNLLINTSDGKIIARNLRGEALAKKLAELLD